MKTQKIKLPKTYKGLIDRLNFALELLEKSKYKKGIKLPSINKKLTKELALNLAKSGIESVLRAERDLVV